MVEQEPVAVRVAERRVGAVAEMVGGEPLHLSAERRGTGGEVEDFANLHTPPHQIVARRRMSETTRNRPCADPGAAGVMFLPK